MKMVASVTAFGQQRSLGAAGQRAESGCKRTLGVAVDPGHSLRSGVTFPPRQVISHLFRNLGHAASTEAPRDEPNALLKRVERLHPVSWCLGFFVINLDSAEFSYTAMAST
jgi:hypothetical protein